MTMNTTPMNNILAIDPGLSALGVAVLSDGGQLRHVAVLTTLSSDNLPDRFRKLTGAFNELLTLYRPHLILMEATWRNRNQSLGRVHRVAQLCRRQAAVQGVTVLTVSAGTVRRHHTGSGWASKRELAQVLCHRYQELRIYLRQDRAWKERHFQNIFDALGLALFHLDTMRARKPRSIRTPRHRIR